MAVEHVLMVVGGMCRHSQALLRPLSIEVSLQDAWRFRTRIGSESGGIAGASVGTGVGSASKSRFARYWGKYEVDATVTVVVVEAT